MVLELMSVWNSFPEQISPRFSGKGLFVFSQRGKYTMSLKQFTLIFSEVSKKLELELGDVENCNQFTIQLKPDGVPRIVLNYVEPQDALLIVSEVGYVNKDRESELLHSILHRQFLWLKSAGVSFAMSGDNNAIVAQMLLPVQLMDVDSLGQALSDFTNQIIEVRHELFAADGDTEQSAESVVEQDGSLLA